MTRRDSAIFWAAAIVCAISRFASVARSLWDWDEAHFCLALRDYNVMLHHPHPPGFPVYIGAAKLVRLIVDSDFRALQTVTVIASMLVFPAVFLLARELRMRFETALVAGLLFAFFPNIWFYGGTAFSDVPSIVLVVFAVVFFLRALLPAARGEGGRRPDEGPSPAAALKVSFSPRRGEKVPKADEGDFSVKSQAPHPAFGHPLPAPRGEGLSNDRRRGEGAGGRRDYWIGTLLLALAVGIRPQNLLVGLFPGILAMRRRPWRDSVVALLIGIVVVGAAYGAAMRATGTYAGYRASIQEHSDYIWRIDSYLNPHRPPLWRIVDRFFLKQYQSPVMSGVMSLFVLVSIIGAMRTRDRSVLYAILIFAPFAIMAWVMLDRYSISRFSIGYAPMFALLAADGMRRISRHDPTKELALGAIVAAAFAVWAFPALTEVRGTIAPTVRAVEAARQSIDPRRDQLYVGYSMTPFFDYLAPALPYTRMLDDRGVSLTPAPRPFLVAELTKTIPEGILFARERGRLWSIARRHYFEIVFHPLRNIAEFGAGWFPPERDATTEWRWMGARAFTRLPRPTSRDTLLRIDLIVPPEVLQLHPRLTVLLNGKIIDVLAIPGQYNSLDYHVVPVAGPNLLELRVNKTVRDRSMLVRFLSWGPG